MRECGGWLVAGAMAVMVSACGGGGGGGAGNPATPTAATLSTTQLAFESLYLASHGGAHVLLGNITFVGDTIAPGSSLYADDYQLTASPGATGATWTVARTSVAHTLVVHRDGPLRWMVDGQILVEARPAVARVSYAGNDVLMEYLADDGRQVVHRMLATRYDMQPLSGALTSAPAELVHDSGFGIVAQAGGGGQPLYSTSATWQAGAAYFKVATQRKGDQLQVVDCKEPTTGNAPSPCGSGASTLIDLFPMTISDTLSYRFDQGQVVDVAGVQAWVASTPAPEVATPAYHAFYLQGRSIYRGLLFRDGAPTRTFDRDGGAPLEGSILFNQAAVASIGAALPF